MEHSQVREQLQQALQAIRAGDKQTARQILKPLCAANNADAWWLVAQTTDQPQQIQFALEKALAADPQHERAARQLAAIKSIPPVPVETPAPPPAASLADDKRVWGEWAEKRKPRAETPPPPVYEPDIPKAKPSSGGRRLRLIMVVLAGIIVGVSAVVFFLSLTYTVPPPVLGPYYVRYTAHYIEQAPAPCDTFMVFGVVPDAPGMTVNLRLDRYRQQTITDNTGNFQFEIPGNEVIYHDTPDNHSTNDPPVQLQVANQNGADQSGTYDVWFYSGCAVYVEYQRDTASGLKIGNAEQRPPVWNGPYGVAYSEPTTSPLLICDFTGFTGTAYDDYGPMNGIGIQLTNLDTYNATGIPEYDYTVTGILDAQMGPSGWYIFAEPGYHYLLRVISPQNIIITYNVIYLPPREGCEKNLIKVSITKLERRDGVPFPPLPANWQYHS
ncbi:MAG: hypothetical protein K8I60_14120 [Anaerolineae bacterium]|nr:hypothetical protein [Anaerolineae bacterium]